MSSLKTFAGSFSADANSNLNDSDTLSLEGLDFRLEVRMKKDDIIITR